MSLVALFRSQLRFCLDLFWPGRVFRPDTWAKMILSDFAHGGFYIKI